jgi:homoserine dehydrogenase
METLRIGVAGIGTVGGHLVRLLQENADHITLYAGRPITVTAVSGRTKDRDRPFRMDGIRWYEDSAELAAAPDIDVVVEAIGGAEGSARITCETALKKGKSVVTANKTLLARHGLSLAQLADRPGLHLKFEGAVGGGIPIIKTLRENAACLQIQSIEGIVNGTCNYILSRMQENGLTFDAALQEAQNLGYAERPDPSYDICGWDSAHKLIILAALAFGVFAEDRGLSVTGITDITQNQIQDVLAQGARIRLVATAKRQETGNFELSVQPKILPLSHPLAQISGVQNAFTINRGEAGTITLTGPGAGGTATASALLADLIDIAQNRRVMPFGRPVQALRPLPGVG